MKKVCSRCKKGKPYSDFYKNKNSKDGRRSICKICNNLDAKKYYDENKESLNLKSKKYNNKNKNKLKAYRKKNKKRIYNYYKKWNKENQDKIKQYYNDNKELRNLQSKVLRKEKIYKKLKALEK